MDGMPGGLRPPAELIPGVLNLIHDVTEDVGEFGPLVEAAPSNVEVGSTESTVVELHTSEADVTVGGAHAVLLQAAA